MKRPIAIGRVAAVLAAGALTACPLPQPVPAVEGTAAVTPPRILTASVAPAVSTVVVGTSCAPTQFVTFSGAIDDPNLDDIVEARWFVDYSPESPGVQQDDFPAASQDATVTQRPLAPFRFFPSRYAAGLHIVEVVVSNGFYSIGGDPAGAATPNRTPQAAYETQLFRWVVSYDASGRCE